MIILSSIVYWVVISTLINIYLMTWPKPVVRKKAYPEAYFIQQENRFDRQTNKECAAFSTAYLLRHMGMEADGTVLYRDFPSKKKSGTVYPKGIRTVLKRMGFRTNYYKGTIATLKHEVSQGNPVIVFMKVQRGSGNLHFVPVVGYDSEHIYLAESMELLVNSSDESPFYNRKVAIEEFKDLWNIKSVYTLLYSNTYIAVEMVGGKTVGKSINSTIIVK